MTAAEEIVSISEDLRDWALRQPMFFVASAPWSGKHVNVSPKGMPSATFTVFDANHCAYVDATGSGSETIAHVYENGRVTLCWCSFDTQPRIMRWYCWGSVIEHDSPEFAKMLARMGHERVEGARAIIDLKVWKVGTSCGMSVPLLEPPQSREAELHNDSSEPMPTTAARHFKQRDSLRHWAEKMEGGDRILRYRTQKNSKSLDGLPGIRAARRGGESSLWLQDTGAVLNGTFHETRGMVVGLLTGILIMLFLQSAGLSPQEVRPERLLTLT